VGERDPAISRTPGGKTIKKPRGSGKDQIANGRGKSDRDRGNDLLKQHRMNRKTSSGGERAQLERKMSGTAAQSVQDIGQNEDWPNSTPRTTRKDRTRMSGE